jgi:drug/metabolite transporter (DMT)-like permease
VSDPSVLSPAVPLVAAVSLSWAAVDFLRKALLKEVRPVPLLFLLTLSTVPPLALWAALEGASWRAALAPAYLTPALGSVALNVVANLAYLQALRVSPLSVVVPLLSLTPAFATLLAIPLLGERPGPLALAGVLLVVAGALWLQLSGGEKGESFWRALRREPGAQLAGVTALAWSLTLPLDKLAVQAAGASVHGTLLNGGVAAALLVLLIARRETAALAAVRRVPGTFALALAASAPALGLQLVALRFVWVSWVETSKRGLGSFSAMLLGRVAFGEPITLQKVLAVALMAVGVALLFA